jgi:TetR/AcrR family transcriptional repressor of nem operon
VNPYHCAVAFTAFEPGSDTRTRMLDAAERLAQVRGFNGFSYAHVADELGVTKASLHYHFAGKAELGQALITRYTDRFLEALAQIDADVGSPVDKLAAYAGLYADVLRQERMCLCGMLAAEYETLPEAMRLAILRFFDANQRWLTIVMEQGRSGDTMHFAGTAAGSAQTILDGLEGALLVARAYGDPDRFAAVARRLIASLTTAD